MLAFALAIGALSITSRPAMATGSRATRTDFQVENDNTYPAGHVLATIYASAQEPPYNTPHGTIEVHDAHRSYGTFPAYVDSSALDAYDRDLGSLRGGTYTLTAVYSGDDTFAPSSVTATFTVYKRRAETSVMADRGRGPFHCAPPAVSGQGPCPPVNVPAGTRINFDASVGDADSGQNRPPPPGGSVAFMDNDQQATALVLDGASHARWSVVLPPGKHYITSNYLGDPYYLPVWNRQGWSVVVDPPTTAATQPGGASGGPAGASQTNPRRSTAGAINGTQPPPISPSAVAAGGETTTTSTGSDVLAAAPVPDGDDANTAAPSVKIRREAPNDGGSWPLGIAGGFGATGVAGGAAWMVRRRRLSFRDLHALPSDPAPRS